MKKVYTFLIILILMIVIFNISIMIYARYEKSSIEKLKAIPETVRIGTLETMTYHIIKLAQENDIKIIPSFGTLLGLVRDKGIIKHDYDVDIFLFEEDWLKFKDIMKNDISYTFEETNILWHRKFKIYDNINKDLSVDFFVLYEHKNNIKQDVLLSFSDGGVRDGSLNITSPFRNTFSKTDILPLKEQETKYGNLYFPNNPENLLVKWYGEDWKTPR